MINNNKGIQQMKKYNPLYTALLFMLMIFFPVWSMEQSGFQPTEEGNDWMNKSTIFPSSEPSSVKIPLTPPKIEQSNKGKKTESLFSLGKPSEDILKAIVDNKAEYFKQDSNKLIQTIPYVIANVQKDHTHKAYATNALTIMAKMSQCNSYCKSTINTIIKLIKNNEPIDNYIYTILNAYNNTQYPISQREAWMKEWNTKSTPIYDSPEDWVSLPQVSHEKDITPLTPHATKKPETNAWPNTSQDQITYINRQDWDIPTKIYILQLLWWNSQKQQNIPDQIIIQRALKTLNGKIPGLLHNPGKKIQPLLTETLASIPNNAHEELEKFIKEQQADIQEIEQFNQLDIQEIEQFNQLIEAACIELGLNFPPNKEEILNLRHNKNLLDTEGRLNNDTKKKLSLILQFFPPLERKKIKQEGRYVFTLDTYGRTIAEQINKLIENKTANSPEIPYRLSDSNFEYKIQLLAYLKEKLLKNKSDYKQNEFSSLINTIDESLCFTINQFLEQEKATLDQFVEANNKLFYGYTLKKLKKNISNYLDILPEKHTALTSALEKALEKTNNKIEKRFDHFKALASTIEGLQGLLKSDPDNKKTKATIAYYYKRIDDDTNALIEQTKARTPNKLINQYFGESATLLPYKEKVLQAKKASEDEERAKLAQKAFQEEAASKQREQIERQREKEETKKRTPEVLAEMVAKQKATEEKAERARRERIEKEETTRIAEQARQQAEAEAEAEQARIAKIAEEAEQARQQAEDAKRWIPKWVTNGITTIQQNIINFFGYLRSLLPF